MNKKVLSISIWTCCSIIFIIIVSQLVINAYFNIKEKQKRGQLDQLVTYFSLTKSGNQTNNQKLMNSNDSSIFTLTLNNYITEQKLDNLINNNILNKLGKNFSILLALITSVFMLLSFFTQYQLTKTEKLLSTVEDQKKKLDETFIKIIKDSDLYKDQIFDYSKLVFLRFNDFIKEDEKYNINTIQAIIKLWSLNEIEEGAMLLRDSNDKRSIPYLKNRLDYYMKFDLEKIAEQLKEKYSNIILQLNESILAINNENLKPPKS